MCIPNLLGCLVLYIHDKCESKTMNNSGRNARKPWQKRGVQVIIIAVRQEGGVGFCECT